MAYHNKSDIDAQCRAIIEVSYPLFVIHTNHVTTLPDTPLYNLCEQVYTAALARLPLAAHADLLSLGAILSATFDSAHRAFVLPDTSSTLLATLSADARACIFAQAVAGIVSFLRTMATTCGTSPLTAESVQAKLMRFEASAERARMLVAVEAWPGWGDCFEKAQIGGLIMRAAGVEVAEKVAGETVSVVEVNEFAEAPALFNDGPHPRRDLGVPDQFTIMVLN
ncbi:unnamed protein product [Discula destructiva]